MNSRRKALVMLAPAFPAHELETNWVPSQQVFVSAMKARYPEVHLIVLTFYYPVKEERYDWNGVEVIPFDGRRSRKGKRFFFWRKIWKELNRIRREWELMGLFSFWCGECAAVGHYFGRHYGILHYCWICGQDAKADNKWVRWIRPKPEELVAMSDFLVEEFEENHGVRPGRMIPNAIEPGAFPGGAVRAAGAGVLMGATGSTGATGLAVPSTSRDIHLLGAGSLSRLKRYPLFVEVVAVLRQSIPGIRAVICGEGEDRELLMRLSNEYRLNGCFKLAGELPHREVLGMMQRTKVFLHTSEYEGFGVVCLEALYAGAHVVSFCKPLNEDIPHWHVVDSAEEMVVTALRLLEDEGLECEPVLKYTMRESVERVMALFEGRWGSDRGPMGE